MRRMPVRMVVYSTVPVETVFCFFYTSRTGHPDLFLSEIEKPTQAQTQGLNGPPFSEYLSRPDSQVSAPNPERDDASREPWGANLGHQPSVDSRLAPEPGT